MKSLVEFINENLQQIDESLILFKPTAKNAQDAANVEDAIKNFLNTTKKRYSFNNKHELELFFNDFVKTTDAKILKEFGITDGKSFPSPQPDASSCSANAGKISETLPFSSPAS